MEENNLERLKQKISDLENRISNIEKQINYPAKSFHTEEIPVKYSLSQNTPDEENNQKELEIFSQFFTWLKTDWLMKLGAFIVILGIAWFVSYAFAENWIGPLGRIALGIITGAGILTAGHLTIPKRRVPGQVLVALGSTTILLTVYAARTIYDMFTPEFSLGIMVLVVAATAIISIIRNTQGLAILALLGGVISPILTDSQDPNLTSLLIYIFILDLGVLAVVATRGWRSLILLALITSSLYSIVLEELPDKTAYIFMALFYGLFYISTISAILKSKTTLVADLITATLNSLLILIWVSWLVPDNWKSIILSLVVIVSTVTSFILFKKLKTQKSPIYLYAGIAAVLLGAAMSFELEGEALILALSIESLAVTWISFSLLKNKKATLAASFTPVVPFILAVEERIFDRHHWPENIFNKSFFALLFLCIALYGTSYFNKKLVDLQEKKSHESLIIQITAAVLTTFSLIWLTLHTMFESGNKARGIALIIYAVFGIVLYFFGIKNEKRSLRIGAGLILAGVVLRLLFIEGWDMPLLGRVITFVIIGGLLITTAFFEKNLTQKE